MTIRIAVLGCGLIAERAHFPAYAASEVAEVTVVMSRDQSKAERFRAQYGANAALSDWREAINRDDVDAVDICLPNSLHAPAAIAAAQAGKHILVEKPMATSLEETNAMVTAARTHGVKLMVAQNMRFVPLIEQAKQALDSGLIGRIIAIRGVFNHSGPDDYWGAQSNWFYDSSEAGGGALIDLGIHIADIIRWFKPTPVATVSAMVNTVEKPTKMEDNGMALLQFADNTLGYFQASWVYKPKREVNVVVQGEYGTLFVGVDPAQPLFADVRTPTNEEGERVPIEVPVESRHGNLYDYFARSIAEDREPFISGEEGQASLAVILAAYRSARTGQQVQLDSPSL